MTTTDAAALLRAVLRDPAEDTPRLMYADAIQDDEPERAEFIRLQCRIELLMREGDARPRKPLAKELIGLRELERIALRNSWEEWCPQAVPGRAYTFSQPLSFGVEVLHGDGRHARAFFRRGFLCRIELPCAAFLKHAAALFSAHPITDVVLTDREPESRHNRLTFSWGYGFATVANDYPNCEDVLWGLPGQIFDRMRRDRAHEREGSPPAGVWKYYPTRESAMASVSCACVAYGRKLAGLEPIQ